MPIPKIKDPNDELDYIVDWNASPKPFLGTDTISTSQWIVPAGITSILETKTASTATIWLSGGTAGIIYDLVNRIVTVGGRKADHTVKIRVVDR